MWRRQRGVHTHDRRGIHPQPSDNLTKNTPLSFSTGTQKPCKPPHRNIPPVHHSLLPSSSLAVRIRYSLIRHCIACAAPRTNHGPPNNNYSRNQHGLRNQPIFNYLKLQSYVSTSNLINLSSPFNFHNKLFSSDGYS